MAALIAKVRAPYAAKLARDARGHRRHCSIAAAISTARFDQLILDALMAVKERRDRVLAGLPLGHDAAAGRRRSRCEHLMDQTAITYPYVDRQRDDRRDDQDDPRGRRRQPVQSRSVLPAGRRHGARRRPALRDRPDAPRWASASRAMALDGKPIDAAQEVQGRRLGAGVRGGEGRRRRADLGRDRRAICATQKTITPRTLEPADARRRRRQSRIAPANS